MVGKTFKVNSLDSISKAQCGFLRWLGSAPTAINTTYKVERRPIPANYNYVGNGR